MNAEAGRILVVDDNEDNRDLLSRRLQRHGHAVTTAEDGEQALRILAEQIFDIVLLDVMMPGIDGFETLRRIRLDSRPTRLPVIMATAKDQREDIVRALELEANDYVTKPLDFPVVLARVRTQLSFKRAVDRILELEADLQRRNDELLSANERMRRDLLAAADVQKSLLPAAPPSAPGVGFSWHYRPCDELAGDILNVFRLDERHIAMYLLDVSGHGVPAALLSVTVSRMLQPTPGASSLVQHRGNGDGLSVTAPHEVARELARRFAMSPSNERYFTMVYGVLDVPARELRFVSAGHPGPVYAPRGATPRDLTASSFPIGWFPDAEYSEKVLQLDPGDRLYLYSDGIQEARGRDGKLFGTPRIVDTVDAVRDAPLPESLDRLVRAAHDWGGARFEDDVSALALEITA